MVEGLVVLAEHAVIEDGSPGAEFAAHDLQAHELLVLRDQRGTQCAVEAFGQNVGVDAGREDAGDGGGAFGRYGEFTAGRRASGKRVAFGVPAAEAVFGYIAEGPEVFPVPGGAGLRFGFVLLPQGCPLVRLALFEMHQRVERIFEAGLLPFEKGDPGLDTIEGKFRESFRVGRQALPGAVSGNDIARDLFGFLQPGFGQFFANLGLQFGEALFRCVGGGWESGVPHDHAGTGERPVESVVVACGNGVELVIMTARAGDGEALERFAERVDLVVHDIGADLAEADTIVMAEFAEAQEGSADYRFVDVLGGVDARAFE